MKYLSEIKMVDYVYLCQTESALDSIKYIKPNFYVKGPDYADNASDKTKKILLEKNLVEKYGGKIFYTNDKKFSSSSIINEKNLLSLSDEQFLFLTKMKKRYSYDYIKKKINNFKKLKVSVIGELIFDEYCFGNIIGKAGKEPHLVLKEEKTEMYVGGSGAVARHISSFVKEVFLIAPFGNENYLKRVLSKSLSSNIKTIFLKLHKKFSSIIKKRFIDIASNYKMFGSYKIPYTIDKKLNNNIYTKIKKNIQNSDLLILCDYGHNFIDQNLINLISQQNNFLALNVQFNSANSGFNSLSKYRSINALIINETELKQQVKNEFLDIDKMARSLMYQNKVENLIITRGNKGAKLFRGNHKPIFCPAFSLHAIDKVGAGDSMLSLCALGIKQNLEPDIILFLGSVAAAISVRNIGNKYAINLEEIDRTVEYMLK
jgi:rfaE bifunctional protein kinase chain/domain